MSPTIPLTTLTTPPTTTYHPPHTTIYHHHHHHHIIPYYSYHPNTTVINHGTTIHALAQSQHSNAPHHIILRLSIRFTRFHLMRVTIKWYSVVITILLVAQSTLLLVLLQPKHDLGGASHSLLPSPPQTPSPKSSCPTIVERLPCEPQTRGDTGGTNVEAMAYLYNKFRVAATEVKRQVLKRKGEHVSETPPKVHPACVSNLIVATYNLWNINPPWPKRLDKIVSLIKEVQPHLVGVQEIRKYEGKNQLEILKERLSDYKYSVYEKVQDEQRGEEEGLGILSKHPILETSAINFGNTNRKCLRALIQTPNGNINFFVTHFSLNDIEQCTHALMLWEHLNTFPPDTPQVLVGDMNTYFDFEWPMDLLTQGLTPFMLGPLNPCSAVLLKNLEISTKSTNGQMKQSRTSNFHILKDVWEEIYPAIPKHERIPSSERWWGSWAAPPGHTFSNYDGDQDPSRTDRLYFYDPTHSIQTLNEHSQMGGRGGGETLMLCDATLFGDTPIDDIPVDHNTKPLYPSDHKGVAGYFRIEKNS